MQWSLFSLLCNEQGQIVARFGLFFQLANWKLKIEKMKNWEIEKLKIENWRRKSIGRLPFVGGGPLGTQNGPKTYFLKRDRSFLEPLPKPKNTFQISIFDFSIVPLLWNIFNFQFSIFWIKIEKLKIEQLKGNLSQERPRSQNLMNIYNFSILNLSIFKPKIEKLRESV